MNRVKHVLTSSALYSLYCTLVMPYLTYCCEVWGNNYKTRIQSLFILQKRAIGLYRDVWIAAIASSTTSLVTRTAAICVRFQWRRVRRVYVTMQITFLTRKSALIYRRGLRQRVASLTLNCNGDFAIRAY